MLVSEEGIRDIDEFHTLYLSRSLPKYLGERASPMLIQDKLLETLLHELRHHWESLAGVRDLEREDEGKLQRLLAAGPGSGLPVP